VSVVCSDCNGRRGGVGFVCRYGKDGGRGSVEYIPCYTCNDAGTITEEHAARITVGKKLRAERIARDESVMEAAKRMGVRPSELSDVEHGRPPRTPPRSPE